MKDTIKIENIRFYNQRKLEAAKAKVGDNIKDLLAEYDKLAGKWELLEEEKPKKKPMKKAKKPMKRAKKTYKK